MAANELLVLAILAAAEGVALQRTVFLDRTFRTVFLGAFAVNVALRIFYNVMIYPYFVNPLRHLPLARVRRELHTL